MIFNAFVFMQVFNEINSRKLGAREFNVFESFFNNSLFIIIILLTIVVQITLVEYAGLPLRCVPLNWNEHIICLIIGMFSLCWGVVIKFVPPHWFDRLHMKEDTLTEEEEKQAFTTQFRKSFRASHRASSELRTAK